MKHASSEMRPHFEPRCSRFFLFISLLVLVIVFLILDPFMTQVRFRKPEFFLRHAKHPIFRPVMLPVPFSAPSTAFFALASGTRVHVIHVAHFLLRVLEMDVPALLLHFLFLASGNLLDRVPDEVLLDLLLGH